MSVHAFVDESRRGQQYLLVAAIVDPRDLGRTRKLLRSLLFPGQYELHFKKETPARRRLIISKITACSVEVRVYTANCRRGEELARRECLSHLVADLLDLGGCRLVLDSREVRDEHDRLTIRLAQGSRARDSGLVYEHVGSTQESLLWVADAVAWCVGAGGDWQRRVQALVAKVVDVSGSP